jgi:type I protein arginine methyltransferase
MSSEGHKVHVSYHKWMLQDDVRTEALQAMIDELVRPGDVVADIGTGSGILAVLARRAGAARVHAIDPSPIVKLAERMAADNGEAEHIVFHEADAATVELPEQVDVVFAECLGNFAFGDGMFRALQRFSERWLKPGGRRGPTEVRLYLQPADSRLFWDPWRFWEGGWKGLDLSSFVGAEENRVNVVDVVQSFCWAEPALVATFDPYDRADAYTLSAEWAIPEGRLVTGLAGWFEVDWAPGAPMGSGPADPSTHWSQVIFPVPRRTAGPGERLRASVHVAFSDEERPSYRWQGEWLDQDGEVLDAWSRDEDRLFETD